MLVLLKNTLVIFGSLATVLLIYKFIQVWRESPFRSATMMRLNKRNTEIAFTFLFLGTLGNMLGTFFLGANETLTAVSFDLSLIFWFLFFLTIYNLVRRVRVKK